MTKKKFIRTVWRNYSKLGRRRKNKQKYRRARGVDSKMRLKMKGHTRNVSIGFGTNKKQRHLVRGLSVKKVYNIEDIKNLGKNEAGIVAKVGNKRRIEIANYAKNNKIKLLNLNPEKFLSRIETEKEKRKEEKLKRSKKKEEKEKKPIKEKKKEDKKETIENVVKDYETGVNENTENNKNEPQ
jgi:large subunit ribosomal protein L32e